jgi:anti-anti-sigma regulatory factor
MKIATIDNTATITLDDTFTAIQIAEFRGLCNDINSNCTLIDIDFQYTTHMDSSALGMLLLLRDHISTKRTQIRLKHTTGVVHSTLMLTRFNELFEIT